MDLTHQHVHHAYQQAAHHKKKWEGMKEKFAGAAEGAVSLIEVSTGALIGGAIEGYSQQGTFMHVPINLGVGVILTGVGFAGFAGDEWSKHLGRLGEGLIASFAASAGYKFGQNWKGAGFAAALKGAAHPTLPAAPPVVVPDAAAINAAMQQAAQGG